MQAAPVIHRQMSSGTLTSNTAAAHGDHVQPADVSLDAVVDVLHQACNVMDGCIKPGKTILRDTIR